MAVYTEVVFLVRKQFLLANGAVMRQQNNSIWWSTLTRSPLLFVAKDARGRALWLRVVVILGNYPQLTALLSLTYNLQKY